MPTPAAASARRYRTRHSVKEGLTTFPVDNLLWRDPKVPLRRRDAAVQLELIPREGAPAIPPGLPNREQLLRDRIERTIQDTLSAFRPQLNRVVREVEMHLQACDIRYPEHQVVNETLAVLEKHLHRFATDALAFKTWSSI